ncbi:MAG: hypothetical protein GJ680_01710 [Alteromonadaceae bacterium]|nr:hypothetical protein [Alteromonadaceae bacterium]
MKVRRYSQKTLSFGALSLLVLLSCKPVPESVAVVEVIDGDSIVVAMPNGGHQHIELPYIDAPELEQPFGREAKQALSNLVASQTITLNAKTKLPEVSSFSLTMLQSGHAWLRTDTSFKDTETTLRFNDAVQQAQINKVGLWQLDPALQIAPWQWRNQSTQRSTTALEQQNRIREIKQREAKKSAKLMEQVAAQKAKQATQDTKTPLKL